MAKQVGGNVAAKVEQLVRPTIEELGLRLWDVRYEKEGTDWFLRIYIDRDEPLDTDICEVVSHAVDPLLDKADPVPQSYYLEVGSPGLGRRLVRDEHFLAKQGHKVLAHLIRPDAEGRKEVAGTLLCKKGSMVYLQTENGEEEIEARAASYFKLCDDEDLFG